MYLGRVLYCTNAIDLLMERRGIKSPVEMGPLVKEE